MMVHRLNENKVIHRNEQVQPSTMRLPLGKFVVQAVIKNDGIAR